MSAGKGLVPAGTHGNDRTARKLFIATLGVDSFLIMLGVATHTQRASTSAVRTACPVSKERFAASPVTSASAACRASATLGSLGPRAVEQRREYPGVGATMAGVIVLDGVVDRR